MTEEKPLGDMPDAEGDGLRLCEPIDERWLWAYAEGAVSPSERRAIDQILQRSTVTCRTLEGIRAAVDATAKPRLATQPQGVVALSGSAILDLLQSLARELSLGAGAIIGAVRQVGRDLEAVSVGDLWSAETPLVADFHVAGPEKPRAENNRLEFSGPHGLRLILLTRPGGRTLQIRGIGDAGTGVSHTQAVVFLECVEQGATKAVEPRHRAVYNVESGTAIVSDCPKGMILLQLPSQEKFLMHVAE